MSLWLSFVELYTVESNMVTKMMTLILIYLSATGKFVIIINSLRAKTLLLLEKKSNSNLAQVGKLFYEQLHSLISKIESEFLSQKKTKFRKQNMVIILSVSNIVYF